MAKRNTKPMRAFPEDEQFLKQIAKLRYTNGKDKKEQSPARILKAYINLTKQDEKVRKRLLEDVFR